MYQNDTEMETQVRTAFANLVSLKGRITSIKAAPTIAKIAIDTGDDIVQCIAYQQNRAELLRDAAVGDWIQCYCNIQSHDARDGKFYPPAVIVDEFQLLSPEECDGDTRNSIWLTGQLMSVRQVAENLSICRMSTILRGRLSRIAVFVQDDPVSILKKTDGIAISLSGTVKAYGEYLADGTKRTVQYFCADEMMNST